MLKLDFKQKYLKYKYKYLHIKSQIGGSDSYLWYIDEDGRRFLQFDIINTSNQEKITKSYRICLTPMGMALHNEIRMRCRPSQHSLTYYDKKLSFYKYNSEHLSIGIKFFKVAFCMQFLEKNLFNLFDFTNIDILSVGSGNGLFENMIESVFKLKIICIDPDPLSFFSTGISESYTQPTYKIVNDYVSASAEKKKSESILLLIWPTNTKEDEYSYDIEAIKALNPLAFFIIYGYYPDAGSKLLRTTIEDDIFIIGDQRYQKNYFIVGNGQVYMFTIRIKMALCVNITKINYQAKQNLTTYCKPAFSDMIRDVKPENIDVDLGDITNI
jgi:hypothetical protein